MLRHPLIARTVAEIVADGGGRVEYDTGGGGREVLIAASAELAATTDAPLVIVESRVLHAEIRSLISELQPGLSSAVLSADEAALQPAGSISGVLAVHADVLRDPAVRQPLLQMARSADHLIVARHDYSDTTLDSLAAPAHELRLHDLVPRVTATPRPGVRERRQAAMPPRAIPSGLRELVAAHWASIERKWRAIDQLNQEAPDGERGFVDYEEHAELLQNTNPDEVKQRIERLRERAETRSAPHRHQHAPHVHPQDQSAAHQQHGPQGMGHT
ncbi:hypothetical protein O1L68_40260 [Streptomyces lydicus]|nr:hypothetical protein [Streptomyces lydicus]